MSNDSSRMDDLKEDVRDIKEDVGELKVSVAEIKTFNGTIKWLVGILIAMSGISGAKNVADLVEKPAHAASPQAQTPR